ncbi:MAG: hypothetical protein ACTIIH_09555, partial [Brevibacterium sp.]
MNQFVTEWNTWRDSRNSALAKPFGWLSVVGLHWLDAESTWTDAPGTFTVDDGWVSVSLKTGIKAGPAAETFDLLSTVDNGGTAGDAGSSAVNGGGPTRATSAAVPSDTSTLPRVMDQAGAGAAAAYSAGGNPSAGTDAGSDAGSDGRPDRHAAVPARPQVRVEENGFSAK